MLLHNGPTGAVERLAYTPDEAAYALGVSRAHIYTLMNAGELPSVKVGKCRRILAPALMSYLASLAGDAA